MALTIYGSPRSRTMRVLWMAEELGLAFRHVDIAFDDPALKSAWFLAINPAGAIPAIEDDGVRLAESLAINLYLAKRYDALEGGLYPPRPEAEAQAWRWTLWAQGELEPWVTRDARLAAVRMALAPHAPAMVGRALTYLERALAERAWLGADWFTVADLNVAAVLSPSRTEHLDLAPFANVEAWLARVYARPAARRVRARFA